MQLYKLADQFQEATSSLTELYNNNEIDHQTFNDTMDALEGELSDKCLNVGMHIKNLRSNLKELDGAKKEFEKRISQVKGQLDFYEYYLDFNMKKSGLPELNNPYVKINYRKLPDVIECSEAPPEYSTIIPESSKPDRRKILQALKDGKDLPFAVLVSGRSGITIK